MPLHAQSPHHKHKLQFSQASGQAKPKPKILVVEDDTSLCDAYRARLEEEGYTVIASSDGKTALELAVQEMPDIILTGIMMPKLSGFDTISILKSTPELQHIPIIVCGALSDSEDIETAHKLGAAEYLVASQVTIEEVVAAVKRHVPKA